MLKAIRITTCLALASLLSPCSAALAQSGPLREGARRTGEAVVEGTRDAVRGTRNAIGRAGQATRNAARTTVGATRGALNRDASANLNGNSNAGAQAGSAQTQSSVDLNAHQDQINANGQIGGQTYDPNGQGLYAAGYRGLDTQGINANPNKSDKSQEYQQPGQGQANYRGRSYRLRFDAQGREFICVGGHPVYFDNQSGNRQTREAYKMNSDMMQRNSYQGRQDANPLQAENGTASVPPAPPAPMRSDVQDVNPAGPTVNTETGANQPAGNSDGSYSDSNDADARLDAPASRDGDSSFESNARSHSDTNNEPNTEGSSDKSRDAGR